MSGCKQFVSALVYKSCYKDNKSKNKNIPYHVKSVFEQKINLF